MTGPRVCRALLALGISAGALRGADRVPDPLLTPQVEARVEGLLGRMTQDEKLSLIGGFQDFRIMGIPRLGLPEVRMADGPLGVRNYGPSTAYPAPVGLAATWDGDLAREFGASVGRDARARGVGIMLAPAVNIVRVPQNGRNFEYLSEDPYLAAAFAGEIVTGIQSQGVIATVKHFAVNNQETDRMTIDARVSEQALREIYFPAFVAAVEKGHAGAAMAAYNRLNGTFCSANAWLNTTVLKEEWGFAGVLMSDWGAVHDTLGAANGGLDLEMPSGAHLNAAALRPLMASGQFTQASLDDKVRRILRLEVAHGFLEHPPSQESGPKDDPRSDAVALKIAREAIVLLKNERSALPLSLKKTRQVVVLGPNAESFAEGGGSGHVEPFHFVGVADGLRLVGGPKIKVIALPGTGPLSDDEAALVRAADAVVVCAGFNQALEHEGADRTFELPAGQPEMIRRAVALNPRTIVVLDSGAAVATSDWIGHVPALLQAWYPGQEGGRALAEIIFGTCDPSGKLPISYERQVGDFPAAGSYPGSGGRVEYSEGILVGYRWFDGKGIAPLFPFGFGLSYTTFNYGDLHVDPTPDGRFAVSFQVTNNGTMDGAEVSEVYVSPPVESGVSRPVRELKGFSRVDLATDQTANVTVMLDRSAFATFDEAKHDWVVQAGSYTVMVGSSSRKLVFGHSISVP